MTHTVTQDIDSAKEVFVGEDKTLTFTVKDSAEPPVVVNITSWTFEFEVRLSRYHPTTIAALQKATGGAGITVPTPANGQVLVAIASLDTAAMKAGTYYYGLARTNAAAYDIVAEGKLVLRKAAVRAPTS